MKPITLCAMAATLALTAVGARAGWQPTLVAAAGGARRPRSEIRIQLPSEVTVDTLQWLALEVDDIDVSELVQLEKTEEGYEVKVRPPQPLKPGAHQVRLVQYTPDGQILERGSWTIHTGKPSGFAEKSLDVNSTVSLGYRVRDDFPGPGHPAAPGGMAEMPGTGSQRTGQSSAASRNAIAAGGGDFQGDGNARIQGRLAKDDWELEGNASVLYNSQGIAVDEPGPDPRSGDEVDLGEYLITRRDAVSEINLGHHAIDQDSLVMEDFYRRGVSATRTVAGGKAKGTAFAMRTEPIIGRRDLLGIEHPDSRVVGGVASVSPLTDEQALTISATALSGKGNDENGTSLSGRDVLAKGNAASIAAQSRLLDDKLRLRGEYARTNYDFDGVGGPLDKVDDDARSYLLELNPLQGKVVNETPVDLTLGLQYQQTGLFFKSIANSFLPADKNLRRVYGELGWGGLNLSLSAGKEHDNVDEDPDFPRLNTELYQVNVSYSPQPEYDSEGNLVTPWYGRPSLSGGLQYGRQRQTRLPADYGPVQTNQRTSSGQLSVGFYYPEWNWYIGHSLGFQDDLTRQVPDVRNEVTSIGVNASLGGRVDAGLQYQYNRIRESDGMVTRTSLWSANLNAQLIPNTLTGKLDYSMNRDRTSDDSLSDDNAILNFELDWQIVAPRGNRPGLALWLRGDYQNFEDQADARNSVTPSQVFVGVRMDSALSYGQGY